MAYYGQGIGRYFGANTFGQDALSNIGLPGAVDPSLDALPTYGASAGYRRFWTPHLEALATERNRAIFPPELLAHAVDPTTVAGIIAYLVSDAADPISGAIVPTYGR